MNWGWKLSLEKWSKSWLKYENGRELCWKNGGEDCENLRFWGC